MGAKEKRRRRYGKHQIVAVSIDPLELAPHIRRCLCSACRQRDDARTARLRDHNARRERCYWAGAPDPQHRTEWRISPQRLADFLKMYDDERDRRGHITHLDMRPRWVAHLDGLLLHRALDQMRRVKPAWAWLITKLVFERVPRQEIAQEWGMSEATLSRRLGDAVRYLGDVLTRSSQEPHPEAEQEVAS